MLLPAVALAALGVLPEWAYRGGAVAALLVPCVSAWYLHRRLSKVHGFR